MNGFMNMIANNSFTNCIHVSDITISQIFSFLKVYICFFYDNIKLTKINTDLKTMSNVLKGIYWIYIIEKYIGVLNHKEHNIKRIKNSEK